MGRERNVKRMRRTTASMSLTGRADLPIEQLAKSYRVRPRSVRRALLLNTTGTASIGSIAIDYMREMKTTKCSVHDAVTWAAQRWSKQQAAAAGIRTFSIGAS